jgi:chromosome segregation ATPase
MTEAELLAHLHSITSKVDRIAQDIQDLKGRMTSIETKLLSINSDGSRQTYRLDRMDERLERIEHSLELCIPQQ